ncbi:MBL fold metallo-hydrolase [Virgibacillus ndiopensis]|uniref:MBL fold metallo-hydrolase n=1 Tax=Virgibacillus ndiopensis TaxID=2004408 RepID=UPI000C0709A3|nr:MBL fold metallo-hydrolase [Virgibacillus ndiopensis]
MKVALLNDTCYYFDAAVNIGYVHHGNQGMLIDAGIDDSVMRKVLKQLEAGNLPITHLFITHAHADHYGGANFLQKRRGVYTIAPVLEEAVLRNPKLEPMYLFGGNDLLPELNNKFQQNKSINVDQVIDSGEYSIGNFTFTAHFLPGHSSHQIGIQIDNILFAGDSYVSEEALHEHKIPYITDADATVSSLKKLLEIECEGAVPGYGVFEANFKETVRKNITYHEELLKLVLDKVKTKPDGISHETIVADMCRHFQINSPSLSQWLLYRTTVTAYLIGLVKREEITSVIEAGKWMFKT